MPESKWQRCPDGYATERVSVKLKLESGVVVVAITRSISRILFQARRFNLERGVDTQRLLAIVSVRIGSSCPAGLGMALQSLLLPHARGSLANTG